MTRGILYYNRGTACLPRLAVSIMTLRDHYAGPVTIACEDDGSADICRMIGDDARIRANVVNAAPVNAGPKRNAHFLAKTRVHELTPYGVTVFIDSDTIICGSLDELHPLAEQHEFVVTRFSEFDTTDPLVMAKIRGVRPIEPRDAGPAINVGVFAFTRQSQFMGDWFARASRARHAWIPDESVCQAEYKLYPHAMVEKFYNASCRYDDCEDQRVRVIHFHGSRHCRLGLPFNGHLWVEQYRRACDLNVGRIMEWTPAGDENLKKYLASSLRLGNLVGGGQQDSPLVPSPAV